MSTTMKTPGVYIQELDAFGNAVVPVPTAVPAFIGYTAETTFNGKNLLNKAVKVTSLAEFLMIFGPNPPQVQYKIIPNVSLTKYQALEKAVDDTTKALAKAIGDAKADATTENTNAIAAINSFPNSKALFEAKTKLAAIQKIADDAGAKATDKQKQDVADAKKVVDNAQEAMDNAVANADFLVGDMAYNINNSTINYRLYSSIKFFYQNGGGDCYIMSIGAYDYSSSVIKDITVFTDAITLLKKETEPTMLVIPDVVEIMDPTANQIKDKDKYLQKKYANAYSLQNAMITHCGEMMNRVAILDIPGGYTEPVVGTTSVQQFRDSVEPSIAKFNSYAAAYYPWLHTTVYQSSEISYKNINKDSYSIVTGLLNIEFTDPKGAINLDYEKIISAFTSDPTTIPQLTSLDKADLILQNLSKSYQLLMGAIMSNMNLMAPSAGMAGIYTSVDNNEGVWVAPANVGVQSTISPSINIDHAAQEDLNMPISGKSVCAIRAFTGRGNLVWGARTLDGNSNDWRYINVRRTLIYIEQSVKDAAKAYVFAPNDAGTWVNVQSMISSFLTGLWKQGGLVGPKPADAFSVSVGLGSTMTSDDILNGIMRVAVKVAVSHPAEFIEITFKQEMQKG